MSPEELIGLLVTVCKINDPIKDQQVYEHRIDCVEHFTNCMIKPGGKIRIDDLKECYEQWRFEERRKK